MAVSVTKSIVAKVSGKSARTHRSNETKSVGVDGLFLFVSLHEPNDLSY